MSENTAKSARCLLVQSSRFGQGNPRLGEQLMESFLKSLKTSTACPDTIILSNSAVVLACGQSDLHPLLASLEEENIRILVSEESLSFYSMEADLKAGQAAGMDEITACLCQAQSVITL